MIIGDGPSIHLLDYSQIGLYGVDEVITCGMQPFHIDYGSLNALATVLIEPWFFCPPILQSERLRSRQNIRRHYVEMVSQLKVPVILNLASIPKYRPSHCKLVHRYTEAINGTTRMNRLRSFDMFAGSFRAALYVACKAGAHTVIIVGFDSWTFDKSSNYRWYEEGYADAAESQIINRDMDYVSACRSTSELVVLAPDNTTSHLPTMSFAKATQSHMINESDNDKISEYHSSLLQENVSHNTRRR